MKDLSKLAEKMAEHWEALISMITALIDALKNLGAEKAE